MSTVRDLYGRFRHLIHEGAKFLVVGAIGTVITFGIANALNNSLGKYGAITVATIVATAATYLGNRYWSFKHRQGHSTTRETVIFFILNGVGLLIYYGSIWVIQDVGDLKSKLWYNVALVVGTGLGTLFRFWSYRKWVWTAPGGTSGLLAPAEDTPSGPPEQESLTPAATASRPAGAHRRS